jgi:hypothetical protein
MLKKNMVETTHSCGNLSLAGLTNDPSRYTSVNAIDVSHTKGQRLPLSITKHFGMIAK